MPSQNHGRYREASQLLDRAIARKQRKRKQIPPSPAAHVPVAPISNPLWFSPPFEPWRLDAPLEITYDRTAP